jgi:hypothetical protein
MLGLNKDSVNSVILTAGAYAVRITDKVWDIKYDFDILYIDDDYNRTLPENMELTI